jgi:hypothetical protein
MTVIKKVRATRKTMEDCKCSANADRVVDCARDVLQSRGLLGRSWPNKASQQNPPH